MTIDLWSLVWTAVLALAMPTPCLVGRMQVPGGRAWSHGNRTAGEPLILAPLFG